MAKKPAEKTEKKRTPANKTEYSRKTHPKAIRKIALLGLSQEESAEYLGISLSIFRRWLTEYPEFRVAWNEGARVVDADVANALLTSALGYNYTKNTIKEKESDEFGDSSETTVEDMHVPGNVQAQMFWLANRQRKNWKMKHVDPEDEAGSVRGGPITVVFNKGVKG